jgi:UDP-N-acetylmuramate--alanine ligase
MEVRGTTAGITVIDDYAHHPTEIAVTLRAVRDRYRQRRTWVVFQPHQHSRTRLLMDEFAGCFDGAYRVLVPDVYAARDSEEDKALNGSRGLVSRLRANGSDARYLPTLEEVAAHLASEVAAGDVVVTMGAGDVWKVADALVERV